MSRLNKYSKKENVDNNKLAVNKVTNFMGGNSYTVNPIDTLRMVTSSAIFAEPSYYRSNTEQPIRNRDKMKKTVLSELYQGCKTTNDVFIKAIREALDFDFATTVEFAVELRHEYNMRLNPAVIYIEASIHEGRVAFNEENPGRFRSIGKEIINRPDDMKNMLDYYMFLKGDKKGLPSIVKRVWASKLQEMEAYHASKYKSKGLIDLIRIAHPKKTKVIDELMTTGDVKVPESAKTWEKLRSEGKTWEEILKTINIPHMALLRNIRGIYEEYNESTDASSRDVAKKLLSGVAKGRQFPFRYYSAYKAVQNSNAKRMGSLLDTLNECIDISMANFPKLDGKVMSLCDNSGSAHGTMTSEFGTVKVSDIANLSAVMTGYNADEGYVGVFGDRLETVPVSKRDGILTQHKAINKIGDNIGMGTENGVWLFWDKAIKQKEHWDHVFIYSDMQAGHGGLYGINDREYSDYSMNGRYIDVLSLVQEYRKKVNPKVNVHSVQVAGYNNSVVPENLYRTSILSGWTGKEVLYASKMNDVWNQLEQR
jgi:hypothetical protein